MLPFQRLKKWLEKRVFYQLMPIQREDLLIFMWVWKTININIKKDTLHQLSRRKAGLEVSYLRKPKTNPKSYVVRLLKRKI
ncbi:MAG: hypothetical protein EU547_03675 [Promethearchaeota archaeon]|nr:MAG: hypothetical protein EU547_03675 [Candidatus Lokiarchaeota archaeon]